MKTRSFLLVTLFAAALAAQPVDRTKPPQSPPIPSYKLPPTYESTLPNGMAVQLVEDARFPLVTIRLSFQAGSKFDPPDTPGLASAVASLLGEGTKTRTARQISEEIDGMGGSLSVSAGSDAMTFSGNILAENLPQLLALAADIARNANFPDHEVELYKQNRLQSLMQQRSQPSFLASQKFSEIVYGASPYAHIAPTEASIQKFDNARLTAFRDAYLLPNNATLILIGKVPARAEAVKMITAEFGSWEKKALPPAPKMDLPAPKDQIVLVDRPGSVQADIRVGRLAPVRTSAEFFPLSVGSTALGGGTSSRMFKDIREKEGFAYDAHTEYNTQRDAASFVAVTQVRNEVIEPAVKAVLEELERMASEPVTAKELTDNKNYLSGLYLLRLETQDGVANQLSNMKALGLPKDYLDMYTQHVRSVEPDQIEAVAKKYVAPGESAVVVVGDASKIGDALKKLGDVRVVKAQ